VRVRTGKNRQSAAEFEQNSVALLKLDPI